MDIATHYPASEWSARYHFHSDTSSTSSHPSSTERRARLVRSPSPSPSSHAQDTKPSSASEEAKAAFSSIPVPKLQPSQRISYEIGPTGNPIRRIFRVPPPPTYPTYYIGPRIHLVNTGPLSFADETDSSKTHAVCLYFADGSADEDTWSTTIFSNEPIGHALEEYRSKRGPNHEVLRFEYLEGQRFTSNQTPNQVSRYHHVRSEA